MKQLLPDLIPKLTKQDMSKVRKCADDKEFYAMLRHYIVKNVNKIFDEEDLKKKRNAFVDASYALSLIANKLKIDSDIKSKRIAYTGKLDNRYYIDIEEQNRILKADILKVEEYGVKNDWPAMILRRHNGKVTKTLGQGEESWKEAISWATLEKPYSSNFIDVLNAVNENDLQGTE